MGDTRFAEHDGRRAAYEIDGDTGPWLVLQHGLGYDRRDWDVLLPALTARCRVVRIDPPGMGDSDLPAAPWTIEDAGEAIRAVLDHAGIQRATVLGASQGGAYVQELARAHPDRIERLILMAPLVAERAMYPDTAVSQATDHALVDGRAGLRALLAGADPADVLDKNVIRRNVEWALSPITVAERPELVDEILAMRAVKPFSPAGWMGQDFAGSEYRYRAELPDLRMPVLVLHGTDDRVVPVAVSDMLERRLHEVRVVRLEGLGHLPHREDPDRIAQLLLAWTLDGEVAA